jgi:hypothetical protein
MNYLYQDIIGYKKIFLEFLQYLFWIFLKLLILYTKINYIIIIIILTSSSKI